MGAGAISSSSGSAFSTFVMPKESGDILSSCLHTCLSACHPHQYPLSTLPSHFSGLVQFSQANPSICCCCQRSQAAPNNSSASPARIFVFSRSILDKACLPSCACRSRRTCRRSRRTCSLGSQSDAFPPDHPPRSPSATTSSKSENGGPRSNSRRDFHGLVRRIKQDLMPMTWRSKDAGRDETIQNCRQSCRPRSWLDLHQQTSLLLPIARNRTGDQQILGVQTE